MFSFRSSNANDSRHAPREDSAIHQQSALRGWSMRLSMTDDEYASATRFSREGRGPLQPLPPSTAAGFVC